MNFHIDKKVLRLLSILLFFLYGFLTFINLIWTTYISTTKNDYHEFPYWTFDNIFITVLLFLAVLLILFLIETYFGISNISTQKLRIIATAFVFTMGILWIFMSKTFPVHDQSIVSNAAGNFIDGNYSSLSPGKYLQRCTHQLGIVWIFQIIYSLVGKNSYIFIMLLNVMLLCGIYNLLFMILKRFTDSIRIQNLYWLIAFFNFAPIFYCTFVYGTIIGLFFVMVAIYFLISFIDNKNFFCFGTCFLLFALACIAKSNYKICVIAAVIVLVFKAIQDKKLFFAPFAIIIALSMFVPTCINMYYSSVSEIKVGKGSPASLWFAMGLQEGPCGNGWYNRYVFTTYNAANGNYNKANELAKEKISNSLSTFRDKPSYAAKFFFDKTLSQWNDPSFQSLWMSDYCKNHYEKVSKVTESIYRGPLNKIFLKMMDMVTLMIWLGNTVFYFRKRKYLSIEQLLLGIIFIGGFIFHFFWEAKSLYIMPYFIFSMLGGVAGIDLIFQKFSDFMQKLIDKKKIRYKPEPEIDTDTTKACM